MKLNQSWPIAQQQPNRATGGSVLHFGTSLLALASLFDFVVEADEQWFTARPGVRDVAAPPIARHSSFRELEMSKAA